MAPCSRRVQPWLPRLPRPSLSLSTNSQAHRSLRICVIILHQVVSEDLTMRKLLLIAVLLTVAVPNAWARPHYDGTYKCDGPNGPVTFVLHEAASGVISGTMTSEGETLKVNGTATAQGAHATISGDEPEDAF